MTWEDVEEEYARTFPRELAPIEVIHQAFVSGVFKRMVQDLGSTIQRMLKGVVAIGNDIERLPSSATGLTLALDDVSMSGA